MEFSESQRFTNKWHFVLIGGILLLTISSNFDTLIAAIKAADLGLLFKLIGPMIIGLFMLFYLFAKWDLQVCHMIDCCKTSLHWNKTICCFFGGVSSLHDESDMFDQLHQCC